MPVSTSAIRAGRAFVELFADDSKLGRTLARAKRQVQAWGGALRTLGTRIAAIGELLQQADRFHKVISTQDAVAAEAFGDRLGELTAVMRGAFLEVGAAAIPVLQELFSAIVPHIQAATQWISENHELAGTIIKVTAAVVAGGAALSTLGTVLSGLGTVLGVVAAVAGLTTWFLTSTETGQRVIGELSDAFTGLGDDAISALGGIRDALASGDWDAAAQIMALAVQVAWKRAMMFLEQQWLKFKFFFIETWDAVVFALEDAFINAVHNLRMNWMELVTALKNAWDTLLAKVGIISEEEKERNVEARKEDLRRKKLANEEARAARLKDVQDHRADAEQNQRKLERRAAEWGALNGRTCSFTAILCPWSTPQRRWRLGKYPNLSPYWAGAARWSIYLRTFFAIVLLR